MENIQTELPRFRITNKTTEVALGNIITLVVLLVTIAVGYGSLTTRVSSNEAQIANLTSAVKETNICIQNLATVLAVTKNMVDERTSRAEERQERDTSVLRSELRRTESLHRAAIQKNADAIETKVTDKKHR